MHNQFFLVELEFLYEKDNLDRRLAHLEYQNLIIRLFTFCIKNFILTFCKVVICNFQIYGTEIPCPYIIFSKSREIIKDIILELKDNKDGITINHLVNLVLYYISNKRKNKLKDIKDNVLDIFKPQLLSKFPIPEDERIDFTISILSFFELKFLDIPDVNIDWYLQNLEVINFEKEDDVIFDDQTPPPSPSCNYSNQDNEILFHNYKNSEKGYEKKFCSKLLKGLHLFIQK